MQLPKGDTEMDVICMVELAGFEEVWKIREQPEEERNCAGYFGRDTPLKEPLVTNVTRKKQSRRVQHHCLQEAHWSA